MWKRLCLAMGAAAHHSRTSRKSPGSSRRSSGRRRRGTSFDPRLSRKRLPTWRSLRAGAHRLRKRRSAPSRQRRPRQRLRVLGLRTLCGRCWLCRRFRRLWLRQSPFPLRHSQLPMRHCSSALCRRRRRLLLLLLRCCCRRRRSNRLRKRALNVERRSRPSLLQLLQHTHRLAWLLQRLLLLLRLRRRCGRLSRRRRRRLWAHSARRRRHHAVRCAGRQRPEPSLCIGLHALIISDSSRVFKN